MSARIATSPPTVPRDGVPRAWSFVSGAAAAAPLVVGLLPFGLLVGTAVAASDDVLAAWTGTLLIHSGSAQLTLLHLLHDGATMWAAVLTAVLICARLAGFSTSLAPLRRGTALRW